MKPRKMIPKKVTMTRAEKPKVFHRDFLGVRTDIPPEVVLRVLPEASCGQLLSAEGSQEGTLRFPSGASAPTPMCTLRLAKL